ncbi:MAG: PG0541 family transporter-associated protein [Chthonomonadales bacterium]
MRLLIIICEASVDPRIIEILTRSGAPGYTRFTGATGSGKNGIRDGTPIWPGLNSVILAGMPETLVPQVLKQLEALSAERSGRLALKVFSLPAEELS